MRKPVKKSSKKVKKNNFEERFALMVEEYNKAKEVLDSMEEGTSVYITQKNFVISYLQMLRDILIEINS